MVALGHHWLTLAADATVKDVEEASSAEWHDVGRPVKQQFRKAHERLHESGATLSHDGSNPGIVVDLTGDVATAHADEFLRFAANLQQLLDAKRPDDPPQVRCTRHDVALDLVDCPELARPRLLEMRQHWDEGKVMTGSTTHSWQESKMGNTLYVGSTKSTRRFRAYDQRGYLRLEYQFRPPDKTAGAWPGILAAADVGDIWRTHAQHCQFLIPWYLELCQGRVVTEPTAPDKGVELQKAVVNIREQYGRQMAILIAAGVSFDSFLDPVPENKKVKSKHKRMAKQFLKDAKDQGLDCEDLEQLVEGMKGHA